MASFQVADIRNIAFCGHGSAGKTSLVDKLLNMTGTVTRPASVDDGTSICDYDEEEKHHKYSIEAAVVHLEHGGKRFHLIDCPGYPEFINQAIGAMRAADTVAIVINAQSGIAVNTRRCFSEAGKAGLARMIVINKIDGENVDFPALVASIQDVFGSGCRLLNVPIGTGAHFVGVASCLEPPADAKGAVMDPAEQYTPLIESIIEVDEKATERYFEGTPPEGEELQRLMTQAISAGSLIPIVCCSAKTGVGMQELLKELGRCGVAPGQAKLKARKDTAEIDVTPNPAGSLIAQVFRTRIDPFVQKINFIRVFSGTLKPETVPASTARRGVKIAQVFQVQASELQPIESAGPGMIVAVTKSEDLHTGSTLGDYVLPPLPFPKPMVGLAVSPKSRGDEAKLSGALAKITEEDSTVVLDRDSQTKELVMNGMSELHLQIVQERLKRRDKVEVVTKEPKIPYRETVLHVAEGSYRHKKQTGGRGQFGEVHMRIHPFPAGTDPEQFCNSQRFPSLKDFKHDPETNYLWVNSVVGGTIPSNFLPAVEKGFRDRMARGVIAGCTVVNVATEVFFGKHHEVDSSEQAFKTAGTMCFRNVFQQAKPVLLEPIVKIEITAPGDKLGDVNSDLSSRRGRVLGTDSAGGGLMVVTAEVPLAEVTTYARSLSSMTGGQGSYTLEFLRYDVVPGNVQQEIMKKAVMKEEEEEG